MVKNIFEGTGVALVTPFRKDSSIDFKSLEKIVNHVIEKGVNYLVVLGTTAETPSLSEDEKRAIVDFVKEINSGRVPFLLGMGGNNTSSLINSISNTDFTGVDGILSVAPYYNKPSQEGIYQHFRNVATASPVPVILYNVPGRTGSNITAQTCLRLAHNFKGQIVAVKEASGDLEQVMDILREKPEGFSVLSGDDALAYSLVGLGGKGVISVIANAYPGEYSTMIRLALEGKNPEALSYQYQLIPVIKALFREGNPAGVKGFMSLQGLLENNLRLPLVPASKELMKEIQGILEIPVKL